MTNHYRWVFWIIFAAVLSLGALYATSISNHYLQEEKAAALHLVNSTAQLIAADADITQQQLQARLAAFVTEHKQIARAYIYMYATDGVIIVADSQPQNPNKPQIGSLDHVSDLSKSEVVRQEDFMQIRAPIKTLIKDQTIPMLGVDFFVTAWYRTAHRSLTRILAIVGLLITFLIAFYYIVKQNLLLTESERSKLVFLSHLPGMAYRCQNDPDWTMLYVSPGCEDLTGYPPEALLFNRDLSFNELIVPEYRRIVYDEWIRVLASRTNFRADYQIQTAQGEIKWVLEMGQGVYDQRGEVQALEGLIIDITEQKTQGEKLKYIEEHDLLTGLYNRKFYEQKKEALSCDPDNYPFSIIIAELNGLRLINGAFGYQKGTQVVTDSANIFRTICIPRCIVAKTESDEFRILLPQTSEQKAQEVIEQLFLEFEIHNAGSTEAFNIDLSLASATASEATTSLAKIEKKAEETLHQRKLLNKTKWRNSMLSSIMFALYARSEETEEHCQRLAHLSTLIGKELNLPQESLDELELIAMLHDIGKIGIDDRILKKPGKLNEEEWTLMKKHTEIGYRIAMSSSDLEPIAPYILTHHERWDGKGYPKGLRGEAIPLLARIIAVVDAYDAMTEDRVYRKALSRAAALEEIGSNAGTQFDPKIAEIFLKIMEDPQVGLA